MERTKQCVRIGGPLDNVMWETPPSHFRCHSRGSHSRQPSGHHHRDVRLVPRASSSLVLQRRECADRLPGPVIDLVGRRASVSAFIQSELARLVVGELASACYSQPLPFTVIDWTRSASAGSRHRNRAAPLCVRFSKLGGTNHEPYPVSQLGYHSDRCATMVAV
jgi:hypothetical protein